jgi:hypothetical protein
MVLGQVMGTSDKKMEAAPPGFIEGKQKAVNYV